jgi:hypothetical protein
LGHVRGLDPSVKYKNFSYPSNPFITFCFLVFISSLLVKTKTEAEASPVIEFIFLNWVSYSSINSNLYLKLCKRSVALPKCTKFSKCEGMSIFSVLEDIGLI